MRKASPQMDPDKMLDGQSRWTEMPFTMLQRILYLCFACLGCFPLEKGRLGREPELCILATPHFLHCCPYLYPNITSGLHVTAGAPAAEPICPLDAYLSISKVETRAQGISSRKLDQRKHSELTSVIRYRG